MTIRIPLAAVPAQKLSVTLGTQRCLIGIYQKSTGLYFDLSVAGTVIVAGMVCRNRVGLVRAKYLGFSGQLAMVDTQGAQDPNYTGLGSRYQLVYLP